MNIGTFDIAEMVVDEAVSQHGNCFKVTSQARQNLKTDCALIDRIVSEFDCESVEAEIDDKEMKLTIYIVCPDIVLEYGRTHPFFSLIQHVGSFAFSAVDDSIRISFTFTGLWGHKD